MQLSNCEGLTARGFPLKENKYMFIFEICSLINPGTYMINKLFHGWFTCAKFYSLVVNKNRTRSPAVKQPTIER